MSGSLTEAQPYIGILLVGGVVLMPVLMIYFSLFAGLLQAYVFTLLSMSYISAPTIQELEEDLDQITVVKQKNKKNFKKNKGA